MTKKTREKSRSSAVAKLTANALLNHASLFIQTAQQKKFDRSAPDAAQNYGEMIASAIEMCFAIELYLKSMWIQIGLTPPETHNLWMLFKRIPLPKLKEALANEYDKRNKNFRNVTAGYQIAVTANPNGAATLTKDREARPARSLITLKEVLVYCADGFATWRYFYEIAKPGEVLLLDYPFARLKIFAEILRDSEIEPVYADEGDSLGAIKTGP